MRPQPYVPVGLDDKPDAAETVIHQNPQKRARVLCSYDAADATELNLTGNEVIFVTECNPPNADYMFGKQGLLKGLVPRAFLELLD
ncbi:Endophilin-B1 [Pseudolycoriella hygida]|uniref:Endophilin-B1 n=1 Tax=Pseudolycoriella hygida TaxID=35572 RepID=A0A9Q0NBB3_9DIPT|nr:Endophilin-B1 [Pseudolycoriella hygida]